MSKKFVVYAKNLFGKRILSFGAVEKMTPKTVVLGIPRTGGDLRISREEVVMETDWEDIARAAVQSGIEARKKMSAAEKVAQEEYEVRVDEILELAQVINDRKDDMEAG